MTTAVLLNAIPAVVVLGGAFVLWGRFAKLEQKVEDVPEKLNGSMLRIAREVNAEHVKAWHPSKSD